MARRSVSGHMPDASCTNQHLHDISDSDNIYNGQPVVQAHRPSSRYGHEQVDYSIPRGWGYLDELAPVLPVENPNESSRYRHNTLEEARRAEDTYERDQQRLRSQDICGGNRITAPEAGSVKSTGKAGAWFCSTSRCVVM